MGGNGVVLQPPSFQQCGRNSASYRGRIGGLCWTVPKLGTHLRMSSTMRRVKLEEAPDSPPAQPETQLPLPINVAVEDAGWERIRAWVDTTFEGAMAAASLDPAAAQQAENVIFKHAGFGWTNACRTTQTSTQSHRAIAQAAQELLRTVSLINNKPWLWRTL